MFGLNFNKLDKAQVWHEDVECFEVSDIETSEVLGHFYLDLYPREGKFNHAAVFPMQKRHKTENVYRKSAAAMVCNFEKPSEEKPSLLYHGDVVTFFHEFGHVMHNICTEANFSRFSGTSVERDFVELPSQMLENWVWNGKILSRLSKNFETQEPLP